MVKWAQACGFEPAAHHRLLIDRLERVVKGQIPRLMISLPPGSAKSTYSSMLFPPHYLAQQEDKLILACSHSGDLATGFGRKCRNLIENHPRELGYSLAKDSKAADRWSTTHGCEYYCAGVGSGLSGRRADLGLIDDPIGKKEDAESKLIRDKQWDWWEFDFLPRLKPNAPVIIIMTRWHEDDLAGRLLAREAHEWEVVNIPLIAEDNDPLGRAKGDPLWPEYFTPKQIADAKASSAFSSLYQGRPAPEEGDYFKREWIDSAVYRSMAELPADLRIYVGSDHALTDREANDKNCLLPVGVDTNGDIWVLPDVWWERTDTGELVEAILDLAQRRKPIEWFAENEHIHKAIGPFLNQRMNATKTYFVLTGMTSSRNLQTRAQSIRGMMKMCKVHFPTFASWWPEARHELLSFPVGKHDDFIAALAEVGQGLNSITRPTAREIPVEEDIQVSFRPTMKWLKEQGELVANKFKITYADR